MITPWDYQEEYSDKALAILREHFIVYFAWEERTGKTLAAILVAEKSAAKNILVITKKKPMLDWNRTIVNYHCTKAFTVTNYHSAHKITGNFDLVILDEAHNYISSFPKPGLIWKQVARLVKGKPIIYLSATPYAQGPQMLYHQFAVSSWSPWKKFGNFYTWFNTYGKPYQLTIGSLNVNQYDKCHSEDILSCVDHLFLYKTRSQLGFVMEPKDQLHYIDLTTETKGAYNTIISDEMIQLPECLLICDTASKMRYALHQLEGGTAKTDKVYHVLSNNEKVDYILKMFGDKPSLVIMYNYIPELEKLRRHFKHATILQATSYAEGIDLYEYENLVIYSQDFSTARHTQRRARQANKLRSTPITVNFLLVKGAISEQVYKTVSKNKKNFVDSLFERSEI